MKTQIRTNLNTTMEKIKSTNDELKKEILENLVQQRISKLAEQLDKKMGTN